MCGFLLGVAFPGERNRAGDRYEDLGLEFCWVSVYENAREVRSLASGQWM